MASIHSKLKPPGFKEMKEAIPLPRQKHSLVQSATLDKCMYHSDTESMCECEQYQEQELRASAQ